MRTAIILSLLIAWLLGLPGNGLLAQDQDEFQKWLKKDQREFNKFVEQQDRDFAEFLKKNWQSFQTKQGLKSFKKPKPTRIPTAPSKPEPKISHPPNIIEKLPPPPPKPEPVLPKPPAVTHALKSASFDYFSQPVVIAFQKRLHLNLTPPLTNEKISKVWLKLASVDQKEILKQLKNYKTNLALNDWGFVHFVYQTACNLIGNGGQEAIAYTWFLLNKSGYDAKIAFKRNRLFLLMPSLNLMFERPFVVINHQKYYFITFKGNADLKGKILTYRGSYQNANQPLALNINRLPKLPQKAHKRLVHFTYAGKRYTVPLEYDWEVVRFFKNYPQTELKLYFEAPASSYLRYSLLKALRELVKGKNEQNAVNLLLRFVQTGFQYRTDDQQFGHEKYMLPDETVYYPSCDCEDRAVLFAYLVRNVLGLEVIGLDYPNHVATAVRFHSPISGNSITYRGKQFVICDPTYVNADAGMVMPAFKGVIPKVISF